MTIIHTRAVLVSKVVSKSKIWKKANLQVANANAKNGNKYAQKALLQYRNHQNAPVLISVTLIHTH